MKTTTNYGFKKPEPNDPYNVNDINEAFDVIDATLKAASDKADTSTTHPSDTGNPHHTTAEQIGLGNVPNVSTNDQTPTYVAATENAALSSGEKLSIAFGKIAKAITSLMSHLADSVGHITATERTLWNAKVDSSGTVANADTVDGKHAVDFLLSSIERVSNADANTFTNGTVHAYTGCTNVPSNYCIVSTIVSLADGYQIAYAITDNKWYTRSKTSSKGWGEWFNVSNGGNAETVDGYHASDFMLANSSAKVIVSTTAPTDTTAVWIVPS